MCVSLCLSPAWSHFLPLSFFCPSDYKFCCSTSLMPPPPPSSPLSPFFIFAAFSPFSFLLLTSARPSKNCKRSLLLFFGSSLFLSADVRKGKEKGKASLFVFFFHFFQLSVMCRFFSLFFPSSSTPFSSFLSPSSGPLSSFISLFFQIEEKSVLGPLSQANLKESSKKVKEQVSIGKFSVLFFNAARGLIKSNGVLYDTCTVSMCLLRLLLSFTMSSFERPALGRPPVRSV